MNQSIKDKGAIVRRNPKTVIVPVDDNKLIISNSDKNFTIEGNDVKNFVIPILLAVSNYGAISTNDICKEISMSADKEDVLSIIRKLIDMRILLEEKSVSFSKVISILKESNLSDEICNNINSILYTKKVCVICSSYIKDYILNLAKEYNINCDFIDEKDLQDCLANEDSVKYDLIYYHSNFENVVLIEMINDFCLNNNIPYIFSKNIGFTVEIGPFVIPFKTSCVVCEEKRKLSAMNFPIENETIKEYVKINNISIFKEEKDFNYFDNLAAIHSVMEIFKFFTKDILWKYPETIENKIRMDFLNADYQYFRILKNPICPKCSSKAKTDIIENRAWSTKHLYQ